MAVAAEALLRLRTVFDGSGLDAARRALGGIEREAKGLRSSLKDVVSSASWQGAAAAATGIGAGLVYSAKKAIELETQMVQVRKVVDFSSPQGLKNMTQDIVELSTKLPYAAKELAEIAAAAGMAGYAEKDIMKFVQAAAQMGTAFNMSAKDAGDAMVAFQAAMGLSLDEAIKLGDAINHLSDNLQGVVEPAALVEVTKRIGAIGTASGLTAEQVAALGAAFLAPGTQAEVAATGMKNFLKALTIGNAGSDSFKAAFGKIGLDAQQVAKDMQTKAVPTIKDVLSRIAALPKEMQAGVITKIFGEESKAAIMPLLTNLKLVDQAFGLVADKSKYAGSMQKEFNNQMNSTEAQLKIFKNTLDALAISLGQALLPGINAILGALKPVVAALAFLSQKIPGFSGLIVGLGAAFAGLVISAPFISSLITVAGALSRLGILATIAGWLGAVGPWLARIAPWVLNIGSVVARIGPILGSLMPVLLTVGRVLLGIFTGPVGWATLLISAGVALYAFRDKIAAFFTWLAPSWNTYVVTPLRTLWNTFLTWVGTTFTTLGPQLAAAFTGLSMAFQTYVVIPIQTIWGIFLTWIRTSLVTAAVGWWMGVTSGFNLYVVQPVQLAFTTLITWIGQAITQLRTWFATIWTGIAQGFSAYVLIPIQTAWGMFSQWFLQTAANIRAAFVQLWASVSQAFYSYVVQPVQQGWAGLVQFVGQGVANLRQILSGAWNGVTAGFNAAVVQPLRQGWGSVLQWMQSAAGTAARGVAGAFSSVASAIRTNMIQPLQQTFQNFVSWVQNTITRLINWLNGVQARIQALMARVPGGGGGGGGGPKRYATGGYVNGPTLAWVGEGRDSEYIVPAGKMAAASMAYLNGARGMDVINGKIPGFARGGFVKGNGQSRGPIQGSGTVLGSGFVSYDSPEYKAIEKSMRRGFKMGDTVIFYDEKDATERIAKLLEQTLKGKKIINNFKGKKIVNNSAASPFKQAAPQQRRRKLREGRDKAISGSREWIMGGSIGSRMDLFGFFEGSRNIDLFGQVPAGGRKIVPYASGGYVKGPTLGLIGEGRDNEYIIPERRMAESAMAYLNGARGTSVLTRRVPGFANGGVVGRRHPMSDFVNSRGGGDTAVIDRPIEITTGPVMEFNGDRYVTMEDYQRGLRDVKRQTLGELRTAAGRRATGR